MTQLWKLRSAIISGKDISVFRSQANGRKQNLKNFSLQMIADLSFQGCITNVIFYILLSVEFMFENPKKKYSKRKADLKKAKKSCSSLQDTQSAKIVLEPCIFLSW